MPNWPGYLINPQGEVFSQKTNKYLKQAATRAGYVHIRVSLGRAGYQKTMYIHREVARMFLPNPKNLREVNHLDCNKQNNAVSNLEWCSRKENVQHAFAQGRFKARDAVHRKATDAERIEATQLYLQGKTVPEIAKIYGASPNTVYAWFNKLISKEDRARLRSINISKGKTNG